jgi:hypothetical protein
MATMFVTPLYIVADLDQLTSTFHGQFLDFQYIDAIFAVSRTIPGNSPNRAPCRYTVDLRLCNPLKMRAGMLQTVLNADVS